MRRYAPLNHEHEAADGFVTLTGDQTVAGIKTFSDWTVAGGGLAVESSYMELSGATTGYGGFGVWFWDKTDATSAAWWGLEAHKGEVYLGGWRDGAPIKGLSILKNVASNVLTSMVYGNAADNPTHTFHGSVSAGAGTFTGNFNVASNLNVGYATAGEKNLILQNDVAQTELLMNSSGTNVGLYRRSGTQAWLWRVQVSNGELLAGIVPWARLTSVPATFPPSAHTHDNITTGNAFLAQRVVDLSGPSADYRRYVIALCEVTNTTIGLESWSRGKLTFNRTNGTHGGHTVDVEMQKRYNTATPWVSMRTQTQYASETVRPCTFTYGGVKYGGVEVYFTASQTHRMSWVGQGNFTPFIVAYYETLTPAVLNSEINSSLNFSEPTYHAPYYINRRPVVTMANVAYAGGQVTVSTAAPSDGVNGDIWLKV